MWDQIIKTCVLIRAVAMSLNGFTLWPHCARKSTENRHRARVLNQCYHIALDLLLGLPERGAGALIAETPVMPLPDTRALTSYVPSKVWMVSKSQNACVGQFQRRCFLSWSFKRCTQQRCSQNRFLRGVPIFNYISFVRCMVDADCTQQMYRSPRDIQDQPVFLLKHSDHWLITMRWMCNQHSSALPDHADYASSDDAWLCQV